MGSSDIDPAPVVVTPAMEEVHGRIPGLRLLIARREVDVHAHHPVEDGGLVVHDAHLTVGHRPGFEERGLLSRNGEHALRGADSRFDGAIRGVGNGHPVHEKEVAVEIREKGSDGDRPDAVFVLDQLLHTPLLQPEVPGNRHFLDVRGPETEDDPLVGQDLGRDHGRRRGGGTLGLGPCDGRKENEQQCALLHGHHRNRADSSPAPTVTTSASPEPTGRAH
jgi:hypothetical protein